MSYLLLKHDVQDMQLVNRADERIGRVDALVLEWGRGEPLRVKTILVGGPVRQQRIGGWARLLGRVMRRIGGGNERGVSAIPFAAVRRIADSIVVDVDDAAMPSEHLERWLCERIVRPIAGADGERK
jgi:sporulation protein YlmC with PRC-barrel domain